MSKNSLTWLRILGCLCIFPLSLTLLLLHKKALAVKMKCLSLAAVCAFYAVMVGGGRFGEEVDIYELSQTGTIETIEVSEKTLRASALAQTVPSAESGSTPALCETASNLEITFFDVGQGDCSIVKCDGKAMLIDGGTSAFSSYIYTYLKNHNIDHIDHIVATDLQDGHIGGLSGALSYADVGTVYCPVEECTSKEFKNLLAHLESRGKAITVPANGETFNLGSAEVSILMPAKNRASADDASLALSITYKNTSFLFLQDCAEASDIIDNDAALSKNLIALGCHECSTPACADLLEEAPPEYAVILAGADGADMLSEDILCILNEKSVGTYSTDLQGSVICKSNGETLEFEVENGKDIDPLIVLAPTPECTPTATMEPSPTQKIERIYIVNRNSGKVHNPSCKSVKKMKESNKWEYTGTLEELIAMGYEACQNCHPY